MKEPTKQRRSDYLVGAAVPRVFYASAEGWYAIQQLLDDEDNQQPSAETISWLTKAE